jgi:hypothetical protein
VADRPQKLGVARSPRVGAAPCSRSWRRHAPRPPFLASHSLCLPVFFSTERAATRGAPAAAIEKSTTSARHHPIPHSIGRILSSSTSPTSPCHHFGSSSAHRAFGFAAVAIVAVKLGSRVAVLLGALTASPLRCSVSASMCWCFRGRPFGVKPPLTHRNRQACGYGRHYRRHLP